MDHDPAAYGDRMAGDYDAIHEGVLDTVGAVTRLAELAGAGPILEWGVGTGRLAIPLRERGFEVHGVDSSEGMLESLRAKPGGGGVVVHLGDFADLRVDGAFTLVALPFNTLFALPDQDAQLRCFANAARHLAPGGRFVVEAWVPELEGFAGGTSVRPRAVGGEEVALVLARLHRADQRITSTQVHFGPAGVRTFPMNHRYAWPAELDLMARLAGLGLEHRWADWRGAPFTDESAAHVSVYRAEHGR
jgi:SAM-dependent methyltransferase